MVQFSDDTHFQTSACICFRHPLCNQYRAICIQIQTIQNHFWHLTITNVIAGAAIVFTSDKRHKLEKLLVIPTIYFGQILSTEVRSYIKLLQNKNKRENIKMWDWGAFICTLIRKLYCRCSIFFLLIGMANQLIQGSRSGNPPSGWRKGGKEETRKERDWDEKEGGGCRDQVSEIYMANRMRKATIRQKRPMASDKANPRMA